MTIAEAAARCGLPESTLRYWERNGWPTRWPHSNPKDNV
jgi:DNA-binding transcriptional MerR regulator